MKHSRQKTRLTEGQPAVLVGISVRDRVTGEKAETAFLMPYLKDKANIVLEDSAGKLKVLPSRTGLGYGILDLNHDSVHGMYRVKLQPTDKA